MRKSFLFFVSFIIIHSLAAQIGINTSGSAPDPSAGLDVSFNNKGFLPPRLSTTERDAISNPVNGLQIFNTTTNCIEYYVNGSWYSLCGSCPAPPAPAGLS